MKTAKSKKHQHVYGYSHVSRKRRTKSDWAGMSISDGFKNNIDYFHRMSAQRIFYSLVRASQKKVARLIDPCSESGFEPKVKPQISPFYTTYPSNLAGHVVIGLTAFLEYKARVEQKSLMTHLNKYLENPAEYDDLEVDPETYKTVARIVAENVQTRLLLEDLSRIPGMSSVELYRLFSASQQSFNFNSLPEIIRAVILYGDILPDWHVLHLHPMTQSILTVLTLTSMPYFAQLAYVKEVALSDVGIRWVQEICRGLASFLPPLKEENDGADQNLNSAFDDAAAFKKKTPDWRYKKERDHHLDPNRIAPLNGPNPPSLLEPENPIQAFGSRFMTNPAGKNAAGSQPAQKTEPSPLQKALEAFSSAIEQAGGQKGGFEDMRSDLLEQVLGARVFNHGPIQGNPAEGHEVKMKFDKDNVVGGEIFDRPVELSTDYFELEKLLESSRLVTEALRRVLYPNIQQVPSVLRYRTSGSIDPARLPLANFSSTVFQKYRNLTQLDKRGNALLVVACDGSGSLNQDQMNMVKIMSCGFLNSTSRSDVQVLAGLYHSGQIRAGLSGALVQWIHHPHKTPSVGRKDAARALISLPNSGTGAQSDALSLAFILNEAKQIARGNMIYMIVISDTAWNRSFSTKKNGFEEVRSFFEIAHDEMKGKLHTTLVALGVSQKTGFEDLLDRIITVSDEELKNYSFIAEKIGVYVASCIRERKRFTPRR